MTTTQTTNESPLWVGQTRHVNGWKIHMFAQALEAVHVADAGKRGKKCARFALYFAFSDQARSDASNLGDALIAAAAAGTTVEQIGAIMTAGCASMNTAGHHAGMHTEVLRAIDVPLPEVSIHTAALDLHIDGVGGAISDPTDVQNGSTEIFTNRSDARRFYDFAKANVDKLTAMSFRQASELLRSLGISTHGYCAVD
jgi:hypothetical protein